MSTDFSTKYMPIFRDKSRSTVFPNDPFVFRGPIRIEKVTRNTFFSKWFVFRDHHKEWPKGTRETGPRKYANRQQFFFFFK